MVTVQAATMKHLLPIDAIAKREGNALGWLPKAQIKAAIERGEMLVAVQDNKVAGFMLYGGTRLDHWTVYSFSVAPPFRNQGIGSALMEHLYEKAAASGAGLKLKVTEDNDKAIQFYLKNKFYVEKTEQSTVRKLLCMKRPPLQK